MSAQCTSCGYRLPAAVGAARDTCPRCGDPLAAADGATVTAPAQPEPESEGPDAPTVSAPPPAAPGSTVTVDQSSTPDAGRGAQPQRLPTIPGYEVIEVLGRGGMGVVYKARQQSPRRFVALKMILAGGHADRFQKEVAAVARLQHPNVVQIHEVGAVGGRPYFSMEYVAGGSLAKHLDGSPLRARDAAHVVAQLARAVQHAHDRGIVHRDLKPANILLHKDEGGRMKDETKTEDGSDSSFTLDPSSLLRPKIADFGLAKYLEGAADGPQTQSGAIMGTPSYMAPEQAKGKTKSIGPAVDIYALGAILYECLTGRPPFREDSQLDTLMKVITDDPPAPRQLRAAIPRDLEVICLKCLRKEPTDRYATAGELADDLERVLEGRPIGARARTARERVVGWARRRRETIALVAGAALVIGVAVAALTLLPRSRTVPVAPEAASGLPPDLRLVPPNAFAFATVRVADLWANPATRELVDHQAKLNNSPYKLDALGQEIELQISIHPNNIERLTVVALDEKQGSRNTVFVIATVQPYSHDRLRDLLTKGGKHLPQELTGGTAYIPAQQNDKAFFPLSDRILLVGDTEAVLETARRTSHGFGQMTPTLERAAQGHALVAGVRPSQDLVREVMSRVRVGPGAEPVAALRNIGVTADISHPTGPDGTVTVDLSGVVAYPDGDRAEAAQPHVGTVVRAMIGEVNRDSELFSLLRALDPLFDAVKDAKWETENDTLRTTAQATVTVAAVKAQLDEAVRQEASVAGMRQIARALQQYHARNGAFPPAVVTDEAGKPLYSWRVLLLPYLGGDVVYRRFHLNRAWDHPSNRALLDQMPAAFAPAGKPGGNTTAYQVLTGSGGVFDTPAGRNMADITDGTARTLLFVEAAEPVPWSKPADVPFDPSQPPKLGAANASGFYAVLADGTVRFIPHKAATPALLRGLFTRAGGETFTLP